QLVHILSHVLNNRVQALRVLVLVDLTELVFPVIKVLVDVSEILVNHPRDDLVLRLTDNRLVETVIIMSQIHQASLLTVESLTYASNVWNVTDTVSLSSSSANPGAPPYPSRSARVFASLKMTSLVP